MRKSWPMTSSPVTSFVSCSCCVKVTTTVRIQSNVRRTFTDLLWSKRSPSLQIFRTTWGHRRAAPQPSTSSSAPWIISSDYRWRNVINLNHYEVIVLIRVCVLQESISDFYWYYSGKDVIDDPGKKNFSKAMAVAKQIFNSLTEYIQVQTGPSGQRSQDFILFFWCSLNWPTRSRLSRVRALVTSSPWPTADCGTPSLGSFTSLLTWWWNWRRYVSKPNTRQPTRLQDVTGSLWRPTLFKSEPRGPHVAQREPQNGPV